MKTILRTGCAVLILAICMSCLLSFGTGTAWAETPEETVTLPGLTWPVERAEGPTAESYPYILRTESAVWHLSADDMELQGEEEYCASLELLLQDLDADFAEARELLAPWIWEEIPPIDIYTDFCGHAERDEIFGAFYYGSRREIRLFHDWDLAARSLLHEYVHYLSFTCTDRPISEGLFGEGVAEYVSHFACRNRMDRNASKRALSPEELQMAAEIFDLDGAR